MTTIFILFVHIKPSQMTATPRLLIPSSRDPIYVRSRSIITITFNMVKSIIQRAHMVVVSRYPTWVWKYSP
jgi:hypothetical protein